MTELAYPSGLPSGQGFVRLREIRDCLQPREVLRWRDLAIDGLCFDSKEARSGNLFFAIRGARSDGALFAQTDEQWTSFADALVAIGAIDEAAPASAYHTNAYLPG